MPPSVCLTFLTSVSSCLTEKGKSTSCARMQTHICHPFFYLNLSTISFLLSVSFSLCVFSQLSINRNPKPLHSTLVSRCDCNKFEYIHSRQYVLCLMTLIPYSSALHYIALYCVWSYFLSILKLLQIQIENLITWIHPLSSDTAVYKHWEKYTKKAYEYWTSKFLCLIIHRSAPF